MDYFMGGDKPYLITGSNDHTAKVCPIIVMFSQLFNMLCIYLKKTFDKLKVVSRFLFVTFKLLYFLSLGSPTISYTKKNYMNIISTGNTITGRSN